MIKIKKLSFKNLKNLNIQERIEAAKTPGIGQTLMSALTPTQIADLFPRYYLMREPDISGFLKAMPTSMSAARQAQFQEQLNNTASGAAAGSNMESGGWKRKLQQGVSGDTATVLKPGQAPAPKLTDAQMATVSLLTSGKNIAIDDPQVKFISTLSSEQLKIVGLEKYKGEGDKEFYKYVPPQTTVEEAKKSLQQSGNRTERENAVLDLISKREGAKDPNTIFGGEKYKAAVGYTKPLTEMSINEVLDMQSKLTRVTAAHGIGGGRGSSAVGSGQFIKGTLIENLDRLKIPRAEWDNIKFDSNLQKRVTLSNFKHYVGDPNGDPSQWNQYNLGKQWESLDTTKGFPALRNTEIERVRQASSERPTTIGDYRQAEIDAEIEKLNRDISAKRIRSLEQFTRADLPIPGSLEAQQFFSDGKSEAAVRERISQITGMKNSECVTLAKAYVGATGSVRDWRRGNNVLDGNLRPGTPIATFMDIDGKPSPLYDAGGTGRPGNDTTHAAVFIGYQRDQAGKITGIKVADQWATSGGIQYRTYPIESKRRTTSAKNFYAINDPKGEPLGESNPMRVLKQSEQHQGGLKTESVADGRINATVTESAAQTRPDKKQDEPVEAPHGHLKLGETKASTPEPVPEKKPEPQTIKQFVKGEGYAGIKDVPNPKYVAPNTESKDTGVGPKRVDTNVTTDAAQKKPDTAPGTVNPPPKGLQKLDTAPQPVKTNALGGSNRTHTDQITALPIGGIKDDNSVVVDSNQRPLFTMNTNKETAVYDPTERKVDVIPNQKPGQVGRAPEPGNDLQQQLDGLKADILGMNENTQAPAPQDAAKGSVSHISDRDPHMIDQILDMTRNLFLDPSAARAFSRARFHETGDATNDFHHSSGNSNMQ